MIVGLFSDGWTIHILSHDIDNINWIMHSLVKSFKGVNFRTYFERLFLGHLFVGHTMFNYGFLLGCS